METPDECISPGSNSPASDLFSDILNHRRKSSIILPEATLQALKPRSTHYTGCVIRVANPWRTRWDLLIILLALYNSVSVPLEVGFSVVLPTQEEESLALKAVGYFFDSLFAVDIAVSFRSAYMDADGKEVTDPRKIAKSYAASSRFITDVLATFPFEVLAVRTMQVIIGEFVPIGTLKLVKLLKLIRLLRLRRIISYLHTAHSFKVLMRIATILYCLFLYIHLSGCLWVALTNDDWFPPKDTGHETEYYSSKSSQYITCLYYGTLLLLGADIMPLTTGQVVYATVFLLLAAILTAHIYGHMTVLLDTLAEQRSSREREIESSLQSLATIGVSRDLQSKVQVYLNSSFQLRHQQEELQSLLKDLSPSLRFQITMFLFAEALDRALRLKADSKMAQAVAGRLTTQVCKPETPVIRLGDEAQDLFLVSKGEFVVTVLDQNAEETPVRRLGPGDYFGEVGIVMDTKRTATVTSDHFCTYATLPKEDVLDMLQLVPSVRSHLLHHIHSAYRDPWKSLLTSYLSQVPYLQRCGQVDLDSLFYQMEMKQLAIDTQLTSADETVDSLLIVARGSLSLRYETKKLAFAAASVAAGTACFASSLFHGLQSRVKVTALDDAIVMSLRVAAVKEQARKSAPLAAAIDEFQKRQSAAESLCPDFICTDLKKQGRAAWRLATLNVLKAAQVTRRLHPASEKLLQALEEFLQLRAATAQTIDFRGLPQCVKLLKWALRATHSAHEKVDYVSKLALRKHK